MASGQRTSLELLHDVPGLDNRQVANVAIPVTVTKEGDEVRILAPVSLLITKLYALRRFDQANRNDLLHLKIAIQTSRHFIAEAISSNVRFGLWNCQRVISAYQKQCHQRMEKEYGFKLLQAIPIETIEHLVKRPEVQELQRLKHFLAKQWLRLTEPKNKPTS